MGMLDGKVALVTGSGAGIGREIALKFASEGASVMVSDINAEGCAETVKAIRDANGTAEHCIANVTKPEDVTRLIKTTVDTFGALNVACNNAGIEGKIAPLTDQSIEDFDRVFDVNVRGVFLCLKAEVEQMLKNGGGAIVNLASVAGLVGFPGITPYVASKHAVNGMTKNVALEYGTAGIRVNSVCPGVINTRMLDSLVEQTPGEAADARAMMDGLHPIGRVGKTEEVAELITWLCSDKASFVTGANVPVDGGFVAR